MNVSEKKSRVTGLPNSHDGSPRRNITVALNVHSKKNLQPNIPKLYSQCSEAVERTHNKV